MEVIAAFQLRGFASAILREWRRLAYRTSHGTLPAPAEQRAAVPS